MDLLNFTIWRKIIVIGYVVALAAMFGLDWGYNFHIGHAIRLFVGAAAFWLVVDRL